MQKISIKAEEHLPHLDILSKCFKCGFCDENSTKKNNRKTPRKCTHHTKQETEKLTNVSSKPKKIKSKNKIKTKKTPKGMGKTKVQVFVDEDAERFIDDAKSLCESTYDHTSYCEENDSRLSSSISFSDQSFSGPESGEVSDSGN